MVGVDGLPWLIVGVLRCILVGNLVVLLDLVGGLRLVPDGIAQSGGCAAEGGWALDMAGL